MVGLALSTLVAQALSLLYCILVCVLKPRGLRLDLVGMSNGLANVRSSIKGAMPRFSDRLLELIVLVAVATLLAIFNTQVLALFGVTDPELISTLFNCFLWLIPIGILTMLFQGMANFYNSTNHVGLSTALLIAGNSVFYGVAFFLLMPVLGISAAWVSYAVAYALLIPVTLLAYRIVAHKVFPRSAHDIMLLPQEFYDEKNLLNFSLGKDDRDLQKIADVQTFIQDSGIDDKTAMRCALCVEELAARAFKGNPHIVDIRLFTLEGNVHICLRDDGKADNHLVFTPADEADAAGVRMVREMAKSVSYSYMSGFNVLSVEM